jgi:UDP-N-acetylmuramate dehydrogenase
MEGLSLAKWQQKAMEALKGIKFEPDCPMAQLTTFKIGGPVDLLVEPVDVTQLQQAVRFCQAEQLPWMVLGLGSNLLVRDRGVRGVAIKLGGEFAQWTAIGNQISAGAAVPLADLSKATVALGLSGLEFACGIPGSVGGAVYMNAGAYDGELSLVVVKAQAFDPEAGLIWYDRMGLEFGYRRSRFQASQQIVVKVVFELQSAVAGQISAKIADFTCRRETKQPLELPSAGSVFRRPEGYYVGPLIEQAGLMGYRIGGAQVSPKHAGFIVNVGGATAQDVLDLIQHIRILVQDRHGVDLSPEITVIGEE